MKYILIFTALGSLLSCTSNQDAKLDRYYNIFRTRSYSDSTYSLLARYIQKYHHDSLKKVEAGAWITEQQRINDDKLICARAFELIDIFAAQEKCGYFRKHYFAKKITSSEDTLRKATAILVSSLYVQMPINCMTSWPSAGVYLYKSEDDFKKNKYFSMATLFRDGPLEVRLN